MATALLFIQALSPLHAGTGQGTGVIDLPIAREKATGLPFVPGSSMKGVLRDRCKDNAQHRANCDIIFGPETANASDHAGAAQLSDLRLLLLPVRSLKGTFAWVTSPYLLRRFARDAHEGLQTPGLPADVPEPADASARVAADSALAHSGKVFLEDVDLVAQVDARAVQGQPDAAATAWAKWLAGQIFPNDAGWQADLQKRFCVVTDDVMSFLLETATEITARIRLQPDAKTVENGGLWYEESLPTETILAGLVVTSKGRKANSAQSDTAVMQAVKDLTKTAMQVGGKATVGRGLIQAHLAQ